MAYNLFLFSLILAGVFVFFQKNFVSSISLFFLGCCLYGAPLLYGRNFFVTSYEMYNEYTGSIPDTIYYIYSLCMFLVCVVSFFSNYWSENKKYSDSSITQFYAIFLTQLFFLGVFLLQVKLQFLYKDKQYLVQNLSVFYFLASISTVFCFLSYFYDKDRKPILLLAPSLMFIMIDLIMGYRTTTFLMLCSLFLLISFRHFPVLNISKRIGVAALGVTVLLSAFIYKPIYYSVKNEGLSNITFLSDTTFIGSEPFVIMGVFSRLLESNFEVSEDAIAFDFFQYVPLARTVLGIDRTSLNPTIQNQYFSDTTWGLASTGFGSIYFSIGWLGIAGYLCFIFIFCFLSNKIKGFHSATMYFFIAPYILFYFHRNDWHFFIGVFKLAGIVVFMTYVAGKILDVVLKYIFNEFSHI